jgi:HAD superfamily hydrolase (TIGR01549 family)
LLNIDYQKTITSIERCAGLSLQNLYSKDHQDVLFDDFECGRCSAAQFIAALSEKLRYTGPEQHLIDAWNAMLLNMPEERLELLVELNTHYRIFLLSNTNVLHRAAFDTLLYRQNGVRRLADYFEHVYYSHEIGLRKPDLEAFKYVLEHSELKANETLFIDDSLIHCKAAGTLGISAHWMSPHQDLLTMANALNL